jgi:outer membrane murein-binding lipoprotein Lpp
MRISGLFRRKKMKNPTDIKPPGTFYCAPPSQSIEIIENSVDTLFKRLNQLLTAFETLKSEINDIKNDVNVAYDMFDNFDIIRCQNKDNHDYISERVSNLTTDVDNEFEDVHSEFKKHNGNLCALKDAVQQAFDELTGGKITIDVVEVGSNDESADG